MPKSLLPDAPKAPAMPPESSPSAVAPPPVKKEGPVPRLTRSALCRLLEEGRLPLPAWEEALAYLGFRPGARAWGDFWRHVLTLCGALFLAAGVIFFIASNWADMHRFSRLALVQAVVLTTALGAVWRGPDSAVGRICLLGCGICVGPMLAVFGQTYQTGAELWELFRVWTGVLVVLALVGRQAALWLTAWIVGSMLALLYLGRTLSNPAELLLLAGSLPEYVLAQATALLAWEAAAQYARHKPQHAWLQARWLPRLFFFALMANLTLILFEFIVDGRHRSFGEIILYLPSEPVFWGVYAVCLGGGWLWYRLRQPDLFMLACGISSLAALFVALLIRGRVFLSLEVFSFFAWGMIVVGLTWAVGKILIHLQRTLEQEAQIRQTGQEEKHSFFSALLQKREWPDLWAHLRRLNLTPQEPDLAASLPAKGALPWYAQGLLAFGGWVAALLLIVFLGLFVYSTMGFRQEFESPLLMVSIMLMVIAGLCLRHSAFFARRFGFAAALAGAGGASAALCLLAGSVQHWAFFAALPLAVSIPFMRSASYRFLAASFLAVLLPFWFGSMTMAGSDWGYRGREVQAILHVYAYLALNAAWWAVLSCAVVTAFTREGGWRGGAGNAGAAGGKELILPLAFGAYTGLLVFLIFACSMHIDGALLPVLRVAPAPAGLGAGVGFVYLVWLLTAHMDKNSLRMALIGLACLLLPLGWYLPGVGAAIFGMGLARYLSSPVLLGSTSFFLFAYIIYYYYYLGLSLLRKSLTLAAVGLALLAVGLGVKFLTDRFAAPGAAGAATPQSKNAAEADHA